MYALISQYPRLLNLFLWFLLLLINFRLIISFYILLSLFFTFWILNNFIQVISLSLNFVFTQNIVILEMNLILVCWLWLVRIHLIMQLLCLQYLHLHCWSINHKSLHFSLLINCSRSTPSSFQVEKILILWILFNHILYILIRLTIIGMIWRTFPSVLCMHLIVLSKYVDSHIGVGFPLMYFWMIEFITKTSLETSKNSERLYTELMLQYWN